MIIQSLQIKNFKSIINEKVKINDINIFVGNNDAGKSNYLKALNLFFNGQSDFNTPFNFQTDYCKLSKISSHAAKEIEITIELIPPISYKASQNILWTKVWRQQGFQIDKEKRIFVDKTSINTSRSRIKHWLEHLKYRYVPATKSDHYFQELLGDLHDSLAEGVEKQISQASELFTKKIQESTNEISSEISSKLGLNSILKLPQDLRDIFQTLDFNTKFNKVDISLQNRGDGIKSRHIPIILKFLAEQDNRSRSQGAPRIDTIWGFEEPENNLELLKSFELASDFLEYSKDIQILLTTHSPAFYSLNTLEEVFPNIRKFDKKKISTYFVDKNADDNFSSKTTIVNNVNLLNGKMGLLPLISPMIVDKVKENEKLKSEMLAIKKQIVDATQPIVLTEGKTDSLILNEAWNRIHSGTSMPFKIISCDTNTNCNSENAGATMLKSALSSCRTDEPFTIGIFDYDEEGIKQFSNLDRNFNLKDSIKFHKNKNCASFCLPLIHGKEDYYTNTNFPIEFMFPEIYISMKNKSQRGLIFEQINKVTKVGSSIISSEPTTEPYFRKVKENKMLFASEIVTTFPDDAFENFDEIFKIIINILEQNK